MDKIVRRIKAPRRVGIKIAARLGFFYSLFGVG
jgi:hypothetical protein